MDDVTSLEERQLDALGEVANIGAGHAATALSQMTDHGVMISVPRIKVVRLGDVSEAMGISGKVVASVMMQMLGDLTGRTLLLIEEERAKVICDMLFRREVGTTTEFDELAISSLQEAGNILGAAYLNALADFMGMVLLPSVPSFVVDEASRVLTPEYLRLGSVDDIVFSVQTEFEFHDFDGRLDGHYLLFPDVASLNAILEAIRLA